MRTRAGAGALWWWLAVLLSVSGLARADCAGEAPLRSSRSVLAVASSDGSLGSGVVVAPNRVLTAAHAVRGGTHLSVRVDGVARPAHTVSFDLQHDLALLAADTGDRPPQPLIERELRAGERIWVAGFRVADGGSEAAQQLAYGQVIGPWREAIRLSALVEAGQSGGALFVCDGARVRLGGSLSGFGAARDSDGLARRLPDFSLAVPVAALRAFLAAAGLQTRLHTARAVGAS